MRSRLIVQHSVLALLLATVVAGGACAPGESAGSTGKGGSTGSGGRGGSSGTTTGGGGVITTTGAGGITTGTTGAGGSGPKGPQCATKITPMTPMVLDFENYNGMVAAVDYNSQFGGATAHTGDAYAGAYSYGDGSTTPTLSIAGGHPPGMYAVSETVTQAATWGMGGGFWMGCTNASAYRGISFWVRGTSTLAVFSFSLVLDNTVLPVDGGTCTGTADTCKPATKENIPLTADWTQVQIMWADFTPGTSGATSVVPNGDNVTGMGWSMPLQFVLAPGATDPAVGPYVAMPGDLTINIDDVSFIQ